MNQSKRINKFKRQYTTFIFCLTIFFLFSDQNLLAPNLTAIANEFGFDSKEKNEYLGGYIAIGFFVIGGPAALVVGYFTDSVNRCILFGFVITLGEGSCIGTYFVRTYLELFFCRVLTGISIGGATPIIYSVLSDLYPTSKRIYVSICVGVAMSFGIAFGQLIAGVVGPTYGWRLPFLLIGVPAIMCGLIASVTAVEPHRGSQEREVRNARSRGQNMLDSHSFDEEAVIETNKNPIQSAAKLEESHNESTKISIFPLGMPQSACQYTVSILEPRSYSESQSSIEQPNIDEPLYQEVITLHALQVLFSTPSVWLIFAQGLPGCLPWGMIYTFLNDFLSNEDQLSISDATYVMTTFAFGGIAGQILGGYLGQRLYNINCRFQPILMGVSTLLAVLLMYIILNQDAKQEIIGIYFSALIAGGVVSMNGPNVRSVLQNVCAPEVRGTANAAFTLTDDLGKGLGPALVVQFINACKGDRRMAFNIIIQFWLICGAMLLSLFFTVKKDEDSVQVHVRESLLRHSLQLPNDPRTNDETKS